MFKKKSKLDIDIHPINHDVVEDKPSKTPMKKGLKIVLIVLASIMTLLILLVVITNIATKDQAPNPPDGTPTDEDVVATTPPVVELTDPIEEPSETDPVTEPDTEPNTETPQTGTTATEQPSVIGTKTPDGYVNYNNGILNLETVYPQDWFVAEKTNESLTTIQEAISKLDPKQKGKLDLKTAKFSTPVLVADFTPNDENQTQISVTLISEGVEKATAPKVKKDKEPINLKTSEKTIGKKKYKVDDYNLEDTGQTLRGTRIRIPNGINTFVVSLSALDSKQYVDSVAVAEKIAEYLITK